VSNTIINITTAKREALKKKMNGVTEAEQTKRKETMENLLAGSQYISLNTRKRSVRTFSRVEGSPIADDTGTMVIHGDEKTGTVLINDTNAEGEIQNDAFGVDTVIIKEVDNLTGTVIIKD